MAKASNKLNVNANLAPTQIIFTPSNRERELKLQK
jgi:hypothetical protein